MPLLFGLSFLLPSLLHLSWSFKPAAYLFFLVRLLIPSLPLLVPPPGWSIHPRTVSWGSWLGQEELLSGGSWTHADGLSHAHHPLQTCGKAQEVGQGWVVPDLLPWIALLQSSFCLLCLTVSFFIFGLLCISFCLSFVKSYPVVWMSQFCLCRYVPVSLLLVPEAFRRGRTILFCGLCGAEIRSSDPGPLGQERDCSCHEPELINSSTSLFFFRSENTHTHSSKACTLYTTDSTQIHTPYN